MVCTNCNTLNDGESVFCVNCGNSVTGGSVSSMPTVAYDDTNQPRHQHYTPADSTETSVVNYGQPPPVRNFTPFAPNSGEQKVKKVNPIVWIAVGLVALVGVGVGGFFLMGSQTGASEVLPDHLGMFVQSKEKDRNDEMPSQDFQKVIDAKNSLMKNDGLPVVEAQPNLILYADGRDIPIDELKLVQLDMISDNGNYKHLPIQKALIDGKPAMKRLRMAEPLASGKYAFAIFNSYFNDGKHKFWAFQVKNSTKSDNGAALIASSIPMKPAETSKPAPTQPPGPGPGAIPPSMPPAMPTTGMKTIIGNSVRVRTGPSSNDAFHPSFRFNRGARVNVVAYSGYECPKSGKGCGPWAQIEGGYWIHSSLLR